MDPLVAIAIAKLGIQLAENLTAGTHAQGSVQTISILEQIVEQALAAHQAEVGTPMDLSKFGPQGPAVIPS